jgi:hypothetical protein
MSERFAPVLALFLIGLAFGRMWGHGIVDPIAVVIGLAAITIYAASVVRDLRR